MIKYEKAHADIVDFSHTIWLTDASLPNYPTVDAFIDSLGCTIYSSLSDSQFNCSDFTKGGTYTVKINGVEVEIIIEHHQGHGNHKWNCTGYSGGA